MDSSEPKTIGSFAVLDVIADGGMATVYRGMQTSLDRPVAIKVLSRSLSGDEDAQERFQREARTVAKLNHANVIQIIDHGVADEGCYIVMEYVDGPSLDAVIGKRGIPKIYQAVTIGLQVAYALEHAHSRGVVHRDIKPGNILLDRATGDVKVTDFGIAQLTSPDTADRTLTKANVALGTIDYMSPEQRRVGGKVDERTDIFAFGVLMYEMITGHTPVGRFRNLHEVRDDTPPALNALIQRCLQEDPEDRFVGFTEIIAELKKLSEKELAYRETITRLVDLVVSLPRKITAQTERKPGPDRKPLLKLAGIAAGLVVILVLVLGLPRLFGGPYREQFAAAKDDLRHERYDEALERLRGIRTAAGELGETDQAAEAQWRIADIHEQRDDLALAAIAYAYYADTFADEGRRRLAEALLKAGRYKLLAAGDPVTAVNLLRELAEVSSSAARSDEYRTLMPAALYAAGVHLQEAVRPRRSERQQHWETVVADYQALLDDYPDAEHREDAYWRLASLLDDRKEVRDHERSIQVLQQMADEFPASEHCPLLAAAQIARKELRDNERARRLYEAFLERQPDSQRAADARKELNDL